MHTIRAPTVCHFPKLVVRRRRPADPLPFFKSAEILNSRLAMLGTVGTLAGGHLDATGDAVVCAITMGTFWTIGDRLEMKQEDAEQTGDPWTPDAEILNGRLAMLGFIALLLKPPL